MTKTIIKLCRFFSFGATTLPGKIAFLINPNILTKLTSDLKIIMVTGTNGKTTTTRIIAKMLSLENISYISNTSGANLISGITTTLIEGHTIWGIPKKNVALLEIDEASFFKMSKMISSIDCLIVTNFFRDQLDRCGELYTILQGVSDGISNISCKNLILNADDSLTSFLAKNFSGNIIYYGFSPLSYESKYTISNSDANFCIFCKNEYKYTHRTYNHLGGFYCDKCGYKRTNPDVTCSGIEEISSQSSTIRFKILSDEYIAKLNITGLYNIYNSLCAISLGYLLKFDIKHIISALENFESVFGRMETIKIFNKYVKLILVKNPAGFNQVIDYLLTCDNITIAFLLNDNLADGTDVSWIWDVNFERLCVKNPNVFIGGKRAYDMAVRLKYAGFNLEKMVIIPNYNSLLETGIKRTHENQTFYILPTYTALLEIRNILEKKIKLTEFWK